MGLSPLARTAEIVTAVQDAENREMLQAAVLDGLKHFGFDSFNISVNAKGLHGLLTPELTTFDDAFFAEFDRNGFVEVCPVLATSITSDQTFSWTNRRVHRSPEEMKLIEFLRSVPLQRGMVVPLPQMPGRVSTAIFRQAWTLPSPRRRSTAPRSSCGSP